MPKTFPIVIDVEEVAVGRVMRLLNKTPGVAKFHLDLDREQKQFTNGEARAHSPDRKPYARFDVPGEDVVLEALQKKSPLIGRELGEIFANQGRSSKSISSCLYKLRTSDMIKSTPEGFILTKKARDRMRHRKAAKKGR